ncbi:MAG TPA: hypothetical protein PLL20_18225 [Phycisphaerae bacterium]|nr:hypothetical protein [Phycisphaerae bacterium]HRR85293.1 hypothetical protein [Phycisphaerae bacterium]
MDANELITKIQDKDDKTRAAAVLKAAQAGAGAVKQLAEIMASGEMEVARAAKNALWQIVRHVGRPAADDERKSVVAELLTLCESEQPPAVRREVLWMLSEIAGDETVGAIEPLLANADLREDARMALQRLPGEKSLLALKAALESAPEDFRPNIAVSLRQRGVDIADYPSAKLVPTKATQVKPVRG